MGYVQQIGTPLELYDNPANVFVASFIGLAPMNFFDMKVSGGKLISSDMVVDLTPEEQATLRGYEGKVITLGIRPENARQGGNITMKVSSNENLGHNTLVHGHVGKHRITCKFRDWCEYKDGDVIQISFGRKHFFDKKTTAAIKPINH
jgi:multiple sugar transport system ATP-binding protein